jgi:hypothetical protein
MRPEPPALVKGRHFALEIIILCVRRYLRYALSLRNLEEILAERNVDVDPRYHSALDPMLCTRTQSALSPRVAKDKWILAG